MPTWSTTQPSAMTIDADHENELGMEGVDMYQNQLAKLSGSSTR